MALLILQGYTKKDKKDFFPAAQEITFSFEAEKRVLLFWPKQLSLHFIFLKINIQIQQIKGKKENNKKS